MRVGGWKMEKVEKVGVENEYPDVLTGGYSFNI